MTREPLVTILDEHPEMIDEIVGAVFNPQPQPPQPSVASENAPNFQPADGGGSE